MTSIKKEEDVFQVKIENPSDENFQKKSERTSQDEQVDEKDQSSRRIALCVGCGAQINDKFLLRVSPDLEWHTTCLKCSECSVALDETCTCFVRDGKTYCKRDYYRLFGKKCAKCNQGFNKKDYVMRVKNKIFHVECFRCVACTKQLLRGDEFALREDGLFCKEDHIILENARESYTTEQHCAVTLNTGRPTYQVRHSVQHGKKVEKTTRVRTVLNEKQLQTLRTCYAANPRPDAMMKEQLVEMTGLSPRVIRVWFQNKRCKDKKKSIQMKQQVSRGASSPEDQSSCGHLSDVALQQSMQERNSLSHALVTSSPDSDPGYQPWKALNDFAMQSEIERTPFEQLVNFSEQNPNVNTLLTTTS
ncbi:insulin gene enhancer protein ISL-1-like isoform X2 [Xenia sp. Carnegie-2017]|uniref:insulin gene enhancer protein ISL-1-like isoform X2 n=1 Tax=Xenia sp. Carnegie-2017 TaxID=2897299 RepID=UPI001F04CE60|nr:insulin gene enhancer protein ISL-1-like isoform X2 [Xenia sp. Carnegie-2017]